jgi:carboxyl-terminal processing protease
MLLLSLLLIAPGVSQSAGYGYVAQADAREVTIYNVSAAGCTLQEKLKQSEVPPGSIVWKPLATLPESCRTAKKDSTPLVNIDHFCATFAEHYAFFALRGVDWKTSCDAARAKAASMASKDDVWPLLTSLVEPLGDVHVTLSDGKRLFVSRATPLATQADPDGLVPRGRALQAGLRAWLASANSPVKQLRSFANGKVLHGELNADTGYLAVTDMHELVADADEAGQARAMREILQSLPLRRQMVIDLRYNPGGDDGVALALASAFHAQSALVYRKQGIGAEAQEVHVKPGRQLAARVAILISSKTTSAAEVAVLALRSLPGALLVGQPTQGALSDMLTKRLPNGWEYTLSNETYTAPDGKVFEKTGIPPTHPLVEAAPRNSDERYGRGVQAALAALNQTTVAP